MVFFQEDPGKAIGIFLPAIGQQIFQMDAILACLPNYGKPTVFFCRNMLGIRQKKSLNASQGDVMFKSFGQSWN